jgi:hypothetical protein
MAATSVLSFAKPPRPALGPVWRSALLRRTLVAILAGGFFTYAGMFRTADVPIGVRAAYWVGLMLVGNLYAHVVLGWLDRRPFFTGRPWLRAAALASSLTVPGVFVVWMAGWIAFGHGLLLRDLRYLLGSVPAVAIVMTAVNVLADPRPAKTSPPPATADPPPFLARLPPRLRDARILAVEAEDHFLRVHTDRGSDLILMRLSDAVDELQGLDGARIHRSWWVARGAVVGVTRGGGRARFTLADGLEAPVSRTYAPALRRSGWY